jgi:hypothetical protein
VNVQWHSNVADSSTQRTSKSAAQAPRLYETERKYDIDAKFIKGRYIAGRWRAGIGHSARHNF